MFETGPKCQDVNWSPSLFVRDLGGTLPLWSQLRPGGSALPWLCSRRPRPAPRCGQSVLLAALPLPAGQVGRQAVLGVSGHLSRQAAVNGNCLVENNHNFVTGAYFSNRNALMWKSLGAQRQCILSCKF